MHSAASNNKYDYAIDIPYSLKFSRTKIFVVCQICLEKVIFVIKISWMHSQRTRSFKSVVARPLFSVFICDRKSGLRKTIVANQYKYLIVNRDEYALCYLISYSWTSCV